MALKSRRKGKRGEQEATRMLRAVFPEVRTKRAGGESAEQDRGRDLLGTPGYCIQVRLGGGATVEKKYAEADRAAGNWETPVAVTRRDRGPWLATVSLEAFLDMASRLEHLSGES